MGEWAYRSLIAEHREVLEPDGRTVREWFVTFRDAEWVGWRAILGHLGNEGWEVFSVVVEEQEVFETGQLTGHVAAYRLFCKRPRDPGEA